MTIPSIRIAIVARVAALGVVVVPAGCGSLLSPDLTSITLVNATEASVDVRMLTSDDQLIPEFLLKTVGDETDVLLQTGEAVTFVYDCDEMQAVAIEDADLRLLGGLGPETSTDVLRDGDDFGCGDTIVFTFEAFGGFDSFDVTTSVR